MAIGIHTLTLGALQTNCYFVWNKSTRQAFIIDPADDGDFINEEILRLQLRPQAIICTHGHFDHVLGSLAVKLAWRIPLLIHQQDLFLLKKANQSSQYWTQTAGDPVPPADGFLSDRQKLDLGKEIFKIHHTPGHTPGSIVIHHPHATFVGDLFFAQGIGRADFSYSDPKQLRKSINLVKKLPTQKYYPGHGPDFSIL